MQISHYPKGYKQEKIVGMGLNADELKRNPVIDLQFSFESKLHLG
jgi:hypothetical protein